MNKKIKKRLSIFVCILVVLSALLSVLVIPSSAWTVYDIPFYNYLTLDEVPSTSRDDGRQAYITSKDDMEGVINMSAIYTVNDIYYLPYQYTNLTLRDLLPDVNIGETYVLSGEYFGFNFTADNMFFNRINLVNSEWSSQKQWVFGEPLTITEQDLQANVTIFFANFGTASAKPILGTVVSGSLRIWCNRGQAYEFVSHDIIGDLNNQAIQDAYAEGYDKGYDEGEEYGYSSGLIQGKVDAVKEFYKTGIFTEENFVDFYVDKITVQEPAMPPTETQKIYASLEMLKVAGYEFESYTFNPNGHLPISFANISGQFLGIGVTFNTIVDGLNLQLADIAFTFNDVWAPNGYFYVYITIYYTVDGVQYSKQYGVERFDGNEKAYFNSGVAFDLDKSTLVDKVEIYFDWGPYGHHFSNQAYNSINVTAADTVSPSYMFGYESGFNDGEDYGSDYGYDYGYDDGLRDGKDDALKNDIPIAEQKGFDEGYGKGLYEGKELGFEDGYYKGIADEQAESTFYTLIYSVVDAPIAVFRQMFDFDILGINMSGLFLSMITLALVVSVIRFIL